MIEPHDEKRSISAKTSAVLARESAYCRADSTTSRKQFLLLGYGPLLGVHDLLLFLPKLLGIKAFRIGHRLLANIVLGHETQVGLGHFNKISERSVVLDLKIPNSGLLPFPGFQINDPLLASAPELAQGIELLVKPRFDHFWPPSPFTPTLISGGSSSSRARSRSSRKSSKVSRADAKDWIEG